MENDNVQNAIGVLTVFCLGLIIGGIADKIIEVVFHVS